MSSLPSVSPAAGHGEPTRLVVLIGHQSSVSPADLALSCAGLAELSFLADSGQAGEELLWQIARGVAPTTLVDFTDYQACLDAVRRSGASAVTTFMDRWCALAARLNQALGADAGNQVPWGRKDRHRQLLREAGLSKIRSLVPTTRAELSAFADQVGFPLIVKPVDGFASRNTWLLESRHELQQLLDEPDFDLTGLYAEEFIRSCGPMVPGMADYASVEVFRSGSAAGPAGSTSFITHRPPQAWPCRETGPILPSPLPDDRQRELISFADQVLDALGGYRGMFHIEIKPSPSGLEVIEVNGRIGGYIAKAVHYGTGADLARLGLASSLGRAAALELDWRQYVCALLFQSPAAARRVVRSPSRRELRSLPGVIAIESLSAAGAEVHWRTGTLGLVAAVWVTGADHAELHRRLVGVAEFLTDGFGYVDADDQPVQDRSWLDQLTAQDPMEAR